MDSAPAQPGLTTISGYHQVTRRSVAVTAPSVDAAGAVAGSRSAATGVPSPPDDPDAPPLPPPLGEARQGAARVRRCRLLVRTGAARGGPPLRRRRPGPEARPPGGWRAGHAGARRTGVQNRRHERQVRHRRAAAGRHEPEGRATGDPFGRGDDCCDNRGCLHAGSHGDGRGHHVGAPSRSGRCCGPGRADDGLDDRRSRPPTDPVRSGTVWVTGWSALITGATTCRTGSVWSVTDPTTLTTASRTGSSRLPMTGATASTTGSREVGDGVEDRCGRVEDGFGEGRGRVGGRLDGGVDGLGDRGDGTEEGLVHGVDYRSDRFHHRRDRVEGGIGQVGGGAGGVGEGLGDGDARERRSG